VISVANEGGAETIREREDAAENALRAKASAHPMIQAVVAAFPKAQILSIRTAQDIMAEVEAEALPEVEDEWDPFEEE
jgi:DNA polymerase-3 subunit gamma/tau